MISWLNGRVRGLRTGCLASITAGVAFAVSAWGQQAVAPISGASLPPLAVPHPTYRTVAYEVMVDRPAAAAWSRVGKYCDIAEWFRTTCRLISGTDGQVGAVRDVANGVIELLVARTDLSYTYTQAARAGVPFNAFHGTLEARPVTATTCRLIYSYVYDTSTMPDDAARAAEAAARQARATGMLQNMKILAEGGKLPPAPPR